MNLKKKVLYSIFTTPFTIATYNAYKWQIRRKFEKTEEMRRRKTSLLQEPIKIDSEFLENFQIKTEDEFLPVELNGYFGNKRLLINKTRDGETGYNIISPFYCYKDKDGYDQPLIVDRGWVPYEYIEKFNDTESANKKIIKVKGIIYHGDKENKYSKKTSEDISDVKNKLFYMIPNELGNFLEIKNAFTNKFIVKLIDLESKQAYPRLVSYEDLMVWRITPEKHQDYANFWIIATILNISSNIIVWAYI